MHLPFDVTNTSRHRRLVSRASTGCLSLATGNLMLSCSAAYLAQMLCITESGPENAPRPN